MREAKLRDWQLMAPELPHRDHVPCREFMTDARCAAVLVRTTTRWSYRDNASSSLLAPRFIRSQALCSINFCKHRTPSRVP